MMIEEGRYLTNDEANREIDEWLKNSLVRAAQND